MTSQLAPNIKVPPELHPRWLAYEEKAGLPTKPTSSSTLSIEQRRINFNRLCTQGIKAALALPENIGLSIDIATQDKEIFFPPGSKDKIRLRTYTNTKNESPAADAHDGATSEILYYHGGSLLLGDLDTEDYTTRYICHGTGFTVHSITYTLLPLPQNSTTQPPMHPAISNRALRDAFAAFCALASSPGREDKSLILIGSSAGGQLVAQICLLARDLKPELLSKIKAVFLRCPVTTDATRHDFSDDKVLGELMKNHHSWTPPFASSILKLPVPTSPPSPSIPSNIQFSIGIPYRSPLSIYAFLLKTTETELLAFEAFFNTTEVPLPLAWGDFTGFPKLGMQLCTNDVYYSDGALLAQVVSEAGAEVRVRVWEGWPHTFWLKGAGSEDAVRAEKELVEWLKWVCGLKDEWVDV